MQAQKRAGIRRACLYSATPPQRAGRRSGDPPSADGEPCTGSVRDRCGREIHIAAEQLAGEPLLWTSVKAALAAGASGRRPRFQRMRYAVSCASRWGGLAHRRGLRRGLFAGRFASSVERPAGSPNWPQSAVSGRSPFRGQNGSGPAFGPGPKSANHQRAVAREARSLRRWSLTAGPALAGSTG
jgi:hypothetical protein